jgi:hypothetical protein
MPLVWFLYLTGKRIGAESGSLRGRIYRKPDAFGDVLGLRRFNEINVLDPGILQNCS